MYFGMSVILENHREECCTYFVHFKDDNSDIIIIELPGDDNILVAPHPTQNQQKCSKHFVSVVVSGGWSPQKMVEIDTPFLRFGNCAYIYKKGRFCIGVCGCSLESMPPPPGAVHSFAIDHVISIFLIFLSTLSCMNLYGWLMLKGPPLISRTYIFSVL